MQLCLVVLLGLPLIKSSSNAAVGDEKVLEGPLDHFQAPPDDVTDFGMLERETCIKKMAFQSTVQLTEQLISVYDYSSGVFQASDVRTAIQAYSTHEVWAELPRAHHWPSLENNQAAASSAEGYFRGINAKVYVPAEGTRPAMFLVNGKVGDFFPWREVARFQDLPSFRKDARKVVEGILEQNPKYQASLLARCYRRLEQSDPESAFETMFPYLTFNPLIDDRFASWGVLSDSAETWWDELTNIDLLRAQKALLMLLAVKRATGASWQGLPNSENGVTPASINQFFHKLKELEGGQLTDYLKATVSLTLGFLWDRLDGSMVSFCDDDMLTDVMIALQLRYGPKEVAGITGACLAKLAHLDYLSYEPFGTTSIPMYWVGKLENLSPWEHFSPRVVNMLPRFTLERLSPKVVALLKNLNRDQTVSPGLVRKFGASAFSLFSHQLTGLVAGALSPVQVRNYLPAGCGFLDIGQLTPDAFAEMRYDCLKAYINRHEDSLLTEAQWTRVLDIEFQWLLDAADEEVLIKRFLIANYNRVNSERQAKINVVIATQGGEQE